MKKEGVLRNNQLFTSKLIVCGLWFTSFTAFSFGQRPIAADYNFIGVEHNKQLDFAYNEVLENGLTRETLPTFVNSLAMNFTAEYASWSNVQLGVQYLRGAFASPRNTGTSLYSSTEAQSMSPELRAYLDQLSTIVYGTMDPQAIKAQVTALESRINMDRNITNKDLNLIYSTTSVARYSSDYWGQHFAKWEQLAGFQGRLQATTRNRYIGEDIGGAIAGGTAAAIVNAIPGAGQVAYSGAVLGSAFGASAARVLGDLTGWW